jgi:hypothetical protein
VKQTRSACAALALLASCASVRPEDVPTPRGLEAAAARPPEFPGAASLLAGIDLAGERALRHGDRVLYGVEAQRGDRVERFLLRITASRHRPGFDLGSATITTHKDGVLTNERTRRVRRLDLGLELFDAHGAPLATSRISDAADMIFEESFVDGITAAAEQDHLAHGLAAARLVEIVKLLQSDPILHDLVGRVAVVPWDLRLLFRRELRLVTHFDQGVPLDLSTDAAAAGLGRHFALPFDLLLNDSLLVRLNATVVAPHGPTGATAGIVALRAQQATDEGNQIRLRLLAAERGERSDFVRHGIDATVGFTSEPAALAFSPDGRWLVLPATATALALHDLTAADPAATARRLRFDEPVRTFVFLADGALAVAQGSRLVRVDPLRQDGPTLLHDRGGSAITALAAAGASACFVALADGAIERWSLPTPGTVITVRPASRAEPDAEPDDAADRLDAAGADRVVARCGERWLRFTNVGEHWREEPDDDATRESFLGRGDAPAARVALGGLLAQASPDARASAGGLLLLFGREHTRSIARVNDAPERVVHGFDPAGRFYAYCAPGFRLLVDVHRTAPR